MYKHAYILLCTFVVLCLSSCLKDDSYTQSPSSKLVFSVDTLKMDTTIAGQSSNTYTLQIYNRNKKAIRIADIRLAQGKNSPFHVNVDGTPLVDGEGGGFDVLAKDSVRVFVNVAPPTTDEDDAVVYEDVLRVTTEGGAVQELVITSAGQDVIELNGVVVSSDLTLDAKRPYRILDSLVVASGATLTIEHGVRLLFHPDASLIVHGKLLVNGTLGHEVEMRGDRLGYMFSQQSYDKIPGQWQGVRFTNESFGNYLTYCNIHSGAYGIVCENSTPYDYKLTLENSVIHNVSGDGLYAKNCDVYVGNSQITNAGGNCLSIYGGKNQFVHCTIGRFYYFTGGSGVALMFRNYDEDERCPLLSLGFYNSIITGYQDDEIMGSQNVDFPDDDFSYVFQNCLLNTPKYEDENIIDCVWDEDSNDKLRVDLEGKSIDTRREKNFTPEFDLKKLDFSFALSPNSLAVGTADAGITQKTYSTDRLGNSRTADGNVPDMGCHEAK